MMRIYIVILAGLLTSTAIHAQEDTFQPAIQYLIGFATFNSPETGPYVELYLSINGGSVTFVNKEVDQFQSEVGLTVLFKQEDTIKKFDKYLLQSKTIADTAHAADLNILDVKRYALPSGVYDVEISMKDQHLEGNENQIQFPIKVEYDDNDLQFSDIMLLESFKPASDKSTFTKNGFEMIPYPINFYPTDYSKLTFYAELYNAKKVFGEDPFLVSYSIKTSRTNKQVLDLTRYIKQNPEQVNVLLAEFDISNLPSGNYNLILEVRNKQNELMSNKFFFFQRSNKDLQPEEIDLETLIVDNTFVADIPSDSLDYYLKSLLPICKQLDQRYVTNMVNQEDVDLKRKFLYNFWQKRNMLEPEYEWAAYKTQVDRVEQNYATQIDHGFETDRGRVYLQYGAPNQLQRMPNEPGAMPYEIWQYYALDDNQRNVKFIFYQPNLGSIDYDLIHSTARGEVSDYKWRMKIYDQFKEADGNFDIDREDFRKHHGSKLDDLFAE